MRDPNALIDTATLAASLGEPSLRVFDCTTRLDPTPAGSAEPYIAVPCREAFEEGHIPGADFLDLQGEFSDTGTQLHFMMPSVAHLMAAFGRHGVGPGTRVVLYSSGTMMWATRFWWMLRSLGFDNAAVLDGGLDKWKAEGRPLETGAPRGYPAAIFVAAPRKGLFVDAAAVKAAIGRGDTVTVNALGPQFHRGLEPSRYGRPGRVPGSVNVSAATLVDPATKGFTSARRCRREVRRPGRVEGQAHDLLLRRRHLGHHRPVPAAPARSRRHHALRRFDGRVGEGGVVADRDGLIAYADHVPPARKRGEVAR